MFVIDFLTDNRSEMREAKMSLIEGICGDIISPLVSYVCFNMTSKKLFSLLNEYGLSSNESKVYIGLLKYGHSTVMELSNRIRMNRSTTHLAVNELISKGLVSQTKYGERRILIPETPEKIQLLLENERLNLKRKEEGLTLLINGIYEQVQNLKESTEYVVKYIEGRESIVSLYDSILEAKEIRAYYNYEKILEYFPENIDKFRDLVKERDIRIKDIATNSDSDKVRAIERKQKYSPHYKTKFLPSGITINSMDYLIYDNKIAMIYLEPKLRAIVISSPLLYENLKVLFDLLWQLLPE